MDLSFPALSIIQNSIETEFKKPKKDRSAYTIWVHIRTARDNEDFRLKFYIHCIETPSYNTSITINMRGHFESKHEITIY
jgi:hypothetical protein